MKANLFEFSLATIAVTGLISCTTTAPSSKVPGAPATTKTKVLGAGTELVQDFTPVEQISLYMVGPHVMKDEPGHQMLAHHYCQQVNEDFAQCILYDGNTKDAKMNGIEFIISEKLYNALPAAERANWHPHNYEILSGFLVTPALPAAAEKQALRAKLNTYGKVWQVWNTGMAGIRGDDLPMGKAGLGWSLNADGEASADLMQAAQGILGINISEKRQEREELRPLAKPQQGEDALHGKFGGR